MAEAAQHGQIGAPFPAVLALHAFSHEVQPAAQLLPDRWRRDAALRRDCGDAAFVQESRDDDGAIGVRQAEHIPGQLLMEVEAGDDGGRIGIDWRLIAWCDSTLDLGPPPAAESALSRLSSGHRREPCSQAAAFARARPGLERRRHDGLGHVVGIDVDLASSAE